METLTIHLTASEYELLSDFQDQYYKVYGKIITLEELFKQVLFINSFKLKQKPTLKATKQTVLGGL